jgi:hypothetical protein
VRRLIIINYKVNKIFMDPDSVRALAQAGLIVDPYTGQVLQMPTVGNYHSPLFTPNQVLAGRMTTAESFGLEGIDIGHLAAVNVALNTATSGQLGMTVDEAKKAVNQSKKNSSRK